jgi:hypothetical protein
MKQKDIATIIVIAFLSGIVSFFVSGKVFVTPKSRTQTAEVVDEISTNFQQPDSRFFNSQSINPTQNSQLGDNTNENPFNNNGQ